MNPYIFTDANFIAANLVSRKTCPIVEKNVSESRAPLFPSSGISTTYASPSIYSNIQAHPALAMPIDEAVEAPQC